MDAIEAIHTRHSIGKVKPEPLPRELIEKLLEAGNQAPNHYVVRPWRFVVVTGDARKAMGEVMAASQREKFPDLPPEGSDKTRGLPLRAPLLIAIGVDKPSDPRVIEIENISAASAAAENILLAAHALGLAAQWRTGEWARDAQVKKFLGFSEDQHIAAFLYIGYPLDGPSAELAPRPAVDDHVVWME